jgi:putative transposase
MSIYKAYKYRIYPTFDQRRTLDRNFGAVRFVWNQLVANFNSYGTDDHVKNMSEAHVKSEHVWLKECISFCIQQKTRDFHETTKQFFNKKRKTKSGRPNFKKKGVSRDSMRIPGQALAYNKAVDFEAGTIKITKMTPIKVVYHREFKGELRSVTLSKTKTNEYYVSILVKEEMQEKPKTGKDIGIDLGINHLAILSDGTKFTNLKYFRETQAKLKKMQQHLARKTKGSNRYNQARLKVAKIHEKIARQRNWYYHQVSNYLVTNYDSIFVEDLAVKNMVKNRKLSKAIADVAWSTLVGMMAYKANWYGKEVCKVGRFFASSKTCSCCGHKLDKLDLGTRDWTCPSCHVVHDRDINAAKNIYKEGMKNFHGLLSEDLPDINNRGEDIRPEWFLQRNRLANLNEATSKPVEFVELYGHA